MHVNGAFEAKNTFEALLDRVEQGEEIVITRHGKPVVLLVPNAAKLDRIQARAAAARIRQRAEPLKISFACEDMKTDRDMGHP